jgi:hypothetical protein
MPVAAYGLFLLEEAGGSLFLFSSCIECLGGHDEREAVAQARMTVRYPDQRE